MLLLYPKICPLFIHAYYWFYGYGIKVYLSSFFRLQVTFISSMDILRVFSVLKIGSPFCSDSGIHMSNPALHIQVFFRQDISDNIFRFGSRVNSLKKVSECVSFIEEIW